MIFYFVICLCATALGAISGIGGGIIIKPVLDAVSGLPISTVSFLSGCTVLSMSLVSLARSRGDSVKIELRQGTLLAVGAAVGGVLGKNAFEWIKQLTGNDALVGTTQNAAMIVLTLGVLVYLLCKSRIKTLHVKNAALCLIIGLALGVTGSFLGIGGGPINLVVLYYFFSMDTKTAALNSIYIIFFSQAASFASTLLQRTVPAFLWGDLLAAVLGGVLGGFVGRACSRRMSAKQVDTLFYGLIGVILCISAYNLWRYAGMA